jgi:hypothetical protein
LSSINLYYANTTWIENSENIWREAITTAYNTTQSRRRIGVTIHQEKGHKGIHTMVMMSESARWQPIIRMHTHDDLFRSTERWNTLEQEILEHGIIITKIQIQVRALKGERMADAACVRLSMSLTNDFCHTLYSASILGPQAYHPRCVVPIERPLVSSVHWY